MSTTDTVLVTTLLILLILYFLLFCVALAFIIKILKSIQRVVYKAENVVNSVESAADVLKDATGKFAIFKLIKNIMDFQQHKHKD